MESRLLVETLLHFSAGSYSRELGIDLSTLDKKQLFRWLIAAKLFGRRTNDATSKAAFAALDKRGLTDIDILAEADAGEIIKALESSGYAKGDAQLADELKALSRKIIEDFGGDLNQLHALALNAADLEQKLATLPGIGPISTKVFLRELRGLWDKAIPLPAHSTACSARRLGLTRILAKNDQDLQDVLMQLQKFWDKFSVGGRPFSDFEVALLRQGKNLCLKGNCMKCNLAVYCRYYADKH